MAANKIWNARSFKTNFACNKDAIFNIFMGLYYWRCFKKNYFSRSYNFKSYIFCRSFKQEFWIGGDRRWFKITGIKKGRHTYRKGTTVLANLFNRNLSLLEWSNFLYLDFRSPPFLHGLEWEDAIYAAKSYSDIHIFFLSHLISE